MLPDKTIYIPSSSSPWEKTIEFLGNRRYVPFAANCCNVSLQLRRSKNSSLEITASIFRTLWELRISGVVFRSCCISEVSTPVLSSIMEFLPALFEVSVAVVLRSSLQRGNFYRFEVLLNLLFAVTQGWQHTVFLIS